MVSLSSVSPCRSAIYEDAAAGDGTKAAVLAPFSKLLLVKLDASRLVIVLPCRSISYMSTFAVSIEG
jgi:hypothetical protein